jgi:hypothetical protein
MEAITMLRSGNSLRFTAREVEQHRGLGVDLTGVKTPDDFANALISWIDALDAVRPDLLDKLARELARTKGVKLPPQFDLVKVGPSSNCPEKS